MVQNEKYARGRRISSVDGESRDTHVNVRMRSSLVNQMERFAAENGLTKTDVVELGVMCLLSCKSPQRLMQRYMAGRGNMNRKR